MGILRGYPNPSMSFDHECWNPWWRLGIPELKKHVDWGASENKYVNALVWNLQKPVQLDEGLSIAWCWLVVMNGGIVSRVFWDFWSMERLQIWGWQCLRRDNFLANEYSDRKQSLAPSSVCQLANFPSGNRNCPTKTRILLSCKISRYLKPNQ